MRVHKRHRLHQLTAPLNDTDRCILEVRVFVNSMSETVRYAGDIPGAFGTIRREPFNVAMDRSHLRGYTFQATDEAMPGRLMADESPPATSRRTEKQQRQASLTAGP